MYCVGSVGRGIRDGLLGMFWKREAIFGGRKVSLATHEGIVVIEGKMQRGDIVASAPLKRFTTKLPSCLLRRLSSVTGNLEAHWARPSHSNSAIAPRACPSIKVKSLPPTAARFRAEDQKKAFRLNRVPET